ncbi:variant erythrocyte surface antigen-1 family protein, partial [Babesia divergens]
MVCYMYYTDVFVGQDNIDNLKKALEAELGSSVKDVELNELTALASGLGFLAGLPACLCKTKKSVEEGLGKIYEELKNFNYCISKLNCDLCNSNPYPCKCCVIQSINAVKECECIKTPSNKASCHCAGRDVSCAKVLAGLEACLHLQCLQSDMNEICECKADSDCCKSGKCDGKSGGSCEFCQKLQTQPTTGLGLSPPNPIRLAKRLDKFFGSSGRKGSCDCKCGSDKSCCCLACDNGKCLKSCSCNGSPGLCPHGSQPHPPQNCPCKTFCQNINSIKVSSGSSLMRCCDSGKKCHCSLGGSNCQSGSGCCDTTKKSVKCLIRRLVSYFKSLGPNPSSDDFSKNCCDLLCVAKTCEFLKMFFDKGDSKEFKKHLQDLQYSSPCGHELYRTLKDFLYYCVNMVGAYVDKKEVKDKINAKGNTCKKCPPKGQSGTSPCSCNNQCFNGSSPCPGCKELLGDSHFMAILTRKFSSSYDSSNAKWDSLCKFGSKCCGSSSCSQCQNCSPGSSQCPPQGCCEKCPKRLCAKIFLGMLPCMYWGLKILYDRCKDPVTWPDWQKISMNSDGNPSSALAKFFFAWGFNVSPLRVRKGSEFFVILKDLFGSDSNSNSGPITKLYLSVKLYIRPVPSSDSDPSPSTVRSMLLWLYGLPFTSGFHDLVSRCKDLCSPFGKSFNADAFCYYIHTCCFLLPVAVISTIETSDSAQKAFSSSSEFSKFLYPSDSSALADMFFDYIRKIFAALNFLCIQCSLDKDKAGWRDCYFGQHCQTVKPSSSVSSASTSCCPPGSGQGILCTKDHSGKCSAASSASSSCNAKCPHPLQRFLTATSNSDSESYPFGLPGITPMGFSPDNLPSPGRDGEALYYVLNLLCTNGYYPLTRLVQFALCIFRSPPETLGELFAFFKKFVSSNVFTSKFADYVSGEPGFYSGSDLKKALEDLYGSSNSHSSSSHTPASLYSLSYCEGPKGSNGPHPTCGKYLYPLTENAYKDFIEGFLDTYLSFVCHSAPKFQSEFLKFHTAAKGKFSSCCSDSSCKSILFCPCALALISSQGFQYLSPNSLNCMDNALSTQHKKHGGGEGKPGCTLKSCSDFISQLGKVVGKGSPLQKLLNAIDAFIWHIRLPFFLFILAFWAFVISYFLYVQLYKLDVLELNSHDHPAWSFKILPSTLFS